MIPGRRNDGRIILHHETPAWMGPRPTIVVTTTACPNCQGTGETRVGARREADTGMPLLRTCTSCRGTGEASLEEAGVCAGCGDSYWLEEGCEHGVHACHTCAPSICDDCSVAAADDAGFDPIRWGARH